MKSRINVSELKAGVRNLKAAEMRGVVGGGLLNRFGKKLCGKIPNRSISGACKKVVDVLV
jgi:hypothetical protein